ncbi:hypothetical protein LMG33818_002554 [Halomonadaceae bacterium LMG 33818]|uniref:hypothetical protein n=1 Tax=Cernens ardua TaxID=3402176 RepID=UPI003EDC16B7
MYKLIPVALVIGLLAGCASDNNASNYQQVISQCRQTAEQFSSNTQIQHSTYQDCLDRNHIHDGVRPLFQYNWGNSNK